MTPSISCPETKELELKSLLDFRSSEDHSDSSLKGLKKENGKVSEEGQPRRGTPRGRIKFPSALISITCGLDLILW